MIASIVGDIPSWLTSVVILLAAWRISKGGAGSAVSELSAANRVLERRLHELGAEVRDLRIENEGLKQRTDFSSVMAIHERNAQQRTEGILKVLDLIAGKLGGDEL